MLQITHMTWVHSEYYDMLIIETAPLAARSKTRATRTRSSAGEKLGMTLSKRQQVAAQLARISVCALLRGGRL